MDEPELWQAFSDLQSPLDLAPDPYIKQMSTVFTWATRKATFGVDALLA